MHQHKLMRHALYSSVSVDNYPDSFRGQVKQFTGSDVLPQIYFNEVNIGGNNELQKLVRCTLKVCGNVLQQRYETTKMNCAH